MHTVPGMTTAEAYDQARQEFYALRHREDVERRIAKEEAEATGAYWGKSTLEVSMELEDKVYEEWKAWALKEHMATEQARESAYSGFVPGNGAPSADDPQFEAELGQLDKAYEGQDALGGATVRP